MDLTKEITAAVTEALPGAEIHILDPMNDGVHLHALVIAPQFKTMPLFKQHLAVMQPLQAHFDSEALHALGLKTFTPDSWKTEKQNYPIESNKD